jgi:hypothetical protein
MSIPIPDLSLVDQMDAEHQQLVFERLHFLNFIKKLEPLKPCRCGEPAPALADGPPGTGERRRIECGGCSKFIAWLPKLKNKDRRSSGSTGLAASSFCQCCRKTGVNLVGHHVVEVAEGGSDDPENVWTICEPCHLVIHALRRLAGGA